MASSKRKVGVTVPRRQISLEDWAAGENALKVATREQVVGYVNLHLRAEIVPFVADAIKATERERLRRVWYRRVFRWVVGKLARVLRIPGEADPGERAFLELQKQEREAENDDAPTAIPDEDRPYPKTCINCGSAKGFEAVSERGGLRCTHCKAVLEKPPED